MGCLLAALTPLAGTVLPSWPLPSWLLPSWHLPALALAAPAVTLSPLGRELALTSAAVDIAPAAASAPRPGPAASPLGPALAAVWLAGAAIGLAALAAGAFRLRTLARRAAPVRRAAWHDLARRIARDYGITRPVTLFQSAHPALLVTWGLRHPTILFPAAARFWSDDRIAIVLRHELAHVRRADWLVLVAAALLRAGSWFNPLVWLACRRLRHESERACDDMVLQQGVDGADYATHLVDIARTIVQTRRTWVPAPAVAHPSTLEQRIRAMLNPRCDRTSPSRLTRVAATMTLSCAALIVAAAALSAAAPAAVVVAVDAGNLPGPSAAPAPAEAGGLSTMPARDAALPAAAQVAAPAAQAGRGAFSGIVLDQLGGLVPGTEITLTSAATGGALVAVADRRGTFEFRNLPPGEYTLQTRLPGFRELRTSISVAADAAHTRTLTLPIGSLQETITVTGERGTRSAPPPAAQSRPRQLPADDTGRDPDRALTQLREQLEAVARARGAFQPGTIGGQIKQPTKVLDVRPIYPTAMQAGAIEGNVMLAARIGVDGHVVEALESREADANAPVHPDLVAAAIEAVRGWKFTPTLLNGVPVEVDMRVSVQFSMR
jgi:beta-lactamase regulating signal transducer with metallopeptidase domain